jgi:hypothetical protein
MDIVEELRRACGYIRSDTQIRGWQSSASNGLVLDAADKIERLQAENERLQEHVDMLRSLLGPDYPPQS